MSLEGVVIIVGEDWGVGRFRSDTTVDISGWQDILALGPLCGGPWPVCVVMPAKAGSRVQWAEKRGPTRTQGITRQSS